MRQRVVVPRKPWSGGFHRNDMIRLASSLALLIALSTPGMGASAVNNDGEMQTLVVTENGERSEIEIGAGETQEFCAAGCFVTYPNGDREALTGSETIEISGGAGHVR